MRKRNNICRDVIGDGSCGSGCSGNLENHRKDEIRMATASEMFFGFLNFTQKVETKDTIIWIKENKDFYLSINFYKDKSVPKQLYIVQKDLALVGDNQNIAVMLDEALLNSIKIQLVEIESSFNL